MLSAVAEEDEVEWRSRFEKAETERRAAGVSSTAQAGAGTSFSLSDRLAQVDLEVVSKTAASRRSLAEYEERRSATGATIGSNAIGSNAEELVADGEGMGDDGSGAGVLRGPVASSIAVGERSSAAGSRRAGAGAVGADGASETAERRSTRRSMTGSDAGEAQRRTARITSQDATASWVNGPRPQDSSAPGRRTYQHAGTSAHDAPEEWDVVNEQLQKLSEQQDRLAKVGRACTYVFMYLCMYVCLYLCICVFVYL